MNRSVRRAAPLTVLLALAAGLAASCSSVPSGSTGAQRLDAMAAGETVRDPRTPREITPPPGIPDSLTAPASLNPAARVPLERALELAAERDVDLPEAPAPAALSETLRLSATRMYTQARAALLADRTEEAADLYARVVAIDPRAADAWETLAGIRGAQGDQAAALEAWRNALAIEPTSVRALEQVGAAAFRRGEFEQGLALLARARLGVDETIDPALPYLLDASLAEAFEQSGALLAAAQAAERAASAPAPFDRPTTEQRRLLGLLRQRGLLLRGAGDMLLKLGRPADAADAYARALDLGDIDASPTLARAIYAYRLVGADASAAHTLVRTLERSGGRIDALDLRLVEYLADSLPSRVSNALADALPGIADRGDWGDGLAARSAEVRLAAAAANDPARASDILLEHVVSVGADDAATEQLARALREQPESAAGAVARLTAANPVRATQFVSLFARSVSDREAFERALITRARTEDAAAAGALPLDNAAALAHGWLALRSGGSSGAERALERFRSLQGTPAAAFAAEGEVESLLALGRNREAFSRADALAASSEPVARLIAGAANSQLQRHGEAYALLRGAVESEGLPEYARADAFLLGARAAAATGQFNDAQRWLHDAVRIAPLREDGYAGLIQIGLAAGAAGNQNAQAQLADVVRRLRETIPTSRTLRLLQAREYASQGQSAAALEILDDLLELDPRDDSAQEQYVSTLVSSGNAQRAEAWLKERLEGEFAEASTVVLLARVLASTDREEEAESTLREAQQRFPRNDAIRRERESLLRGPLEDPITADRLALERLSASPPTIDNLLELAEVHARLGEWSNAASALERALSLPGVALRRDQNERLARVIGLFAASAESVDIETARLVADAAGMLAETPGRAPDVVHRARLALLLRADAPLSELISATGAPATQNRDLALQLRLAAITSLRAQDRVEDAFTFLRDGARLGREIAPELIAARAMMAAEVGDAEEAIGAVRTAEDAHIAAESFRFFLQILGIPNPRRDAAEFAYLLSQFFTQAGNTEGADALHELALEYDPNHPWVANNFGYGLAERGEDVLRAYDLIQRAYAQLDTEVAVIDSMGWVRYRVGIFEDRLNNSGEKIEGAVSLLRRAAGLSSASSDYMIYEHLGDALWRAGRAPEAVNAWRRAEDLLQREIQRVRPQLRGEDGNPNNAATAYLETLQNAAPPLRARLNAAEEGRDPDLPAVFEELREPALDIPVPTIAPNPPADRIGA